MNSQEFTIVQSTTPGANYAGREKTPVYRGLVQLLSELNSEQKECLKFRSFETLKRVYDFGALSFL